MHKLTTFFLYAFIADGLFSVMDALGRMAGAAPNPLGACYSLVLLFFGIALFVGMLFTPRLSKRLLLPPILFLGFCVVWVIICGGRGELPISLAEIFVGLGVIVGFKQPDDPPWTIPNFTVVRPGFTLRNFALTALLNGALSVCFALLVGLGLAKNLRAELEDSTGRYLTVQPGGITLEEKTFQRDAREIRLIGMMHIAKSGFYDDVAKALPSSASAMVLLEGVSDRQHLMKDKFDYSHVAQVFGFATQKESSFSKKALEGLEKTEADEAGGLKPANVEYQSGDVDLADLTPETIGFLKAMGTLMGSSSLREALQKYQDVEPELEKNSKNVFADILDKRNEHLLGEIHTALETHTTIVVPWGARHMPDLQEKIVSWGFVETKHVRHQAVHFKNKALIALITLIDLLPDDAE